MSRLRWWWKFMQLPLVLLAVGYGGLAILAPLIADQMLYYPRYGSHRAPEGMRTIRGEGDAEVR